MTGLGANRSTAVMARRHSAADALDYFPTPPWAARALTEYLRTYHGVPLSQDRCWEPACGELYLARGLEAFGSLAVSDIHDYGVGAPVHDFTLHSFNRDAAFPGPVDWIVTNPPFIAAEQFLERALTIAARGIALLVRTSWLESEERYDTIFSKRPPALILQFSERVLLLKGRCLRAGSVDPLTGKKVTTATSYCWCVWLAAGHPRTTFDWIAPCRRRLEMRDDYRLPDVREMHDAS